MGLAIGFPSENNRKGAFLVGLRKTCICTIITVKKVYKYILKLSANKTFSCFSQKRRAHNLHKSYSAKHAQEEQADL